MPHYVFTVGADVMGVAMNVQPDEADRIADDIAAKVGDEVTIHNVPAYTPKPVKEGDVVSGRVANTLPRGTAIARVARVDGAAVKVSSAMLRVQDGWTSGTDMVSCTGGQINETARYKILFIGEPYQGPESTAARR